MSYYSVNMDAPGIIKALFKREEVTPDFHVLRHLVEMPVFVYGTLKKHRANNSLLSGARYYGKAHVISKEYVMKSAGGFPVVLKDETGNHHRANIRGELYGVGVEHMHDLDHLESNGYMYNREKVFVSCEEQESIHGLRSFKQSPTVKAWMYIGDPDFWGNKMLYGQAIQEFKNAPGSGPDGKWYHW